jgi:hypothetical protein
VKRSVVAARMATKAVLQFTAIATTIELEVLVYGENGDTMKDMKRQTRQVLFRGRAGIKSNAHSQDNQCHSLSKRRVSLL